MSWPCEVFVNKLLSLTMSTTNTLDVSITALVAGYTGLRAELVALVIDCDEARVRVPSSPKTHA